MNYLIFSFDFVVEGGHGVLNSCKFFGNYGHTQPVFACSKFTIETLEQGVKYVQS